MTQRELYDKIGKFHHDRRHGVRGDVVTKVKRSVSRVASVVLVASAVPMVPWAQGFAHAAAQSTATCTKFKSFTGAAGHPISVPVTSGGSRNCLLSAAQNGKNATVALQASLWYCCGKNLGKTGLDKNGIDGVFGTKTTKALKGVQKKLALTSDRIYGKNTHNKMMFAWGAYPADGGNSCTSDPTRV